MAPCRRTWLTFVLTILPLAGASCILGSDSDCPGTRRPPRNEALVTIHEGIWGDVWFYSGDFEPGCPTGTVEAVAREVRAYPLLHVADVTADPRGPQFLASVDAEPLAVTHSLENGFFQFELPPGTYSVLLVEDGLLYTDRWGGGGEINPFLVTDGAIVSALLEITYQRRR